MPPVPHIRKPFGKKEKVNRPSRRLSSHTSLLTCALPASRLLPPCNACCPWHPAKLRIHPLPIAASSYLCRRCLPAGRLHRVAHGSRSSRPVAAHVSCCSWPVGRSVALVAVGGSNGGCRGGASPLLRIAASIQKVVAIPPPLARVERRGSEHGRVSVAGAPLGVCEGRCASFSARRLHLPFHFNQLRHR
jgi:hypothetical protein